jgi:hypothetical protein
MQQEKKYPIGGYAPGNYHNRCCTCEKSFFGDKRATQCEPCALEAKARFDALDPNEKELLIKRNARIANYMFSGPLTPERELIYRIVEQWGNAVEMPNMEQWLKDYAAAQHPGTAKWPLSVIDKATGTRHEVNKLVYHPENEPVPHVWCDTWYGHHVIGKDCEWYSESPSKEGNKDAVEDWTDVNDRLPYTYWGVVVRPYNEAHNCWDGEDGDDYYTDAKGGKITHWKPLPESPFKPTKQKQC